MSESAIEWTEFTWNPLAGCSVHSAGCTHCYAMRTAYRLQHNPNPAIAQKFAGTTQLSKAGPVWTGRVNLDEAALLAPLKRRKPTTWFVNSLSDLFHEAVPDEWIDRIFAVMALCPQHQFQVLTKRSARMREYFAGDQLRERIDAEMDSILGEVVDPLFRRSTDARATAPDLDETWPLPNLWLGVSVEDQAAARARIPDLLATPAAVRFLSCEPLLGAVDLTAIDIDGHSEMDALNPINLSDEWREWCEGEPDCPADEQLEGFVEQYGRPPDGKPLHPVLDWVICGGESGKDARPMHPDWARGLRDQCAAAGVPFFFKQWGEYSVGWIERHFAAGTNSSPSPLVWWPDGSRGYGDCKQNGGRAVQFQRLGKKRAGRVLDGRTHDGMPAA